MSAALNESGLAILRDWTLDQIGRKRALMKPLWTNPSPDSNFAAQTITLSESAANFDFIMIKWRVTAAASSTFSTIQFFETEVNNQANWRLCANAGGGTHNQVSRDITVASDGITVTVGAGYFGNSTTAANQRAIPVVFYGVNLNRDVKANAGTSTLLWTNASPTSNFAAQTIAIDLSDYDLYLIDALYEKDSSPHLSTIQKVGNSGMIVCTTKGNNYNQSRNVTYNSDGSLTFDDANYNGATSTSNNNRVVPYHIYGINL